MSKKEIRLHMGFMDEDGNLVEIPENIQKHIEAIEEFWVDKIKDIDNKLKLHFENLEEKVNQDKISFAIEQLEKVKENIKKTPITDFDLSGNFEKMYKQDAIRQIDNQINELKGKVKDKQLTHQHEDK